MSGEQETARAGHRGQQVTEPQGVWAAELASCGWGYRGGRGAPGVGEAEKAAGIGWVGVPATVRFPPRTVPTVRTQGVKVQGGTSDRRLLRKCPGDPETRLL